MASSVRRVASNVAFALLGGRPAEVEADGAAVVPCGDHERCAAFALELGSGEERNRNWR